jgi:hypothetical protein
VRKRKDIMKPIENTQAGSLSEVGSTPPIENGMAYRPKESEVVTKKLPPMSRSELIKRGYIKK